MTEKEQLAELLEFAKSAGVGIVHIHNIKGGITVAFAPVNEFQSTRMVDVAVQVCSIEDTFSKRKGAIGAITKFQNGEFITLPLLNAYPREDLPYVVKQAFGAFYDTISY